MSSSGCGGWGTGAVFVKPPPGAATEMQPRGRRSAGGPPSPAGRCVFAGKRGPAISRRRRRGGRAGAISPPEPPRCQPSPIRRPPQAAPAATPKAAELVDRDLAVRHQRGELAERAVGRELVQLGLGDHAVGEEAPSLELLALAWPPCGQPCAPRARRERRPGSPLLRRGDRALGDEAVEDLESGTSRPTGLVVGRGRRGRRGVAAAGMTPPAPVAGVPAEVAQDRARADGEQEQPGERDDEGLAELHEEPPGLVTWRRVGRARWLQRRRRRALRRRRDRAVSCAVNGSRTPNVAPPPGVASCHSRPPCAATMDATIDRPEARAAALPRAPGVGAVEAVEDAAAVLGLDARPVVDDAQLGRAASPRDPARRRITSTGRPGAACGRARWPAGCRRPGAAGPRRRSPRSPGSMAADDRPVGLHRPRIRHRVLADPRRGPPGRARSGRPWSRRASSSRSSTQRAHPPALRPDPVHRRVERRGIGQAAGPVQVGVAADGGERRAQLVRGVRDEAAQAVLAAAPWPPAQRAAR